jgi:hypothetical protein
MKPQFWLSLMIFVVAAVSPSPSASSNSWFREKYLVSAHDTYYDYTLTRFRLDDNERDMCPDIHKSATIYAITGQYMNKIKSTCNAIYVQKSTHNDNDNHLYITEENRPPPQEAFVETIYIMMTDVVQISGVFACYTFEIGMIVMSVILASCSTLFMIMLLFCQY